MAAPRTALILRNPVARRAPPAERLEAAARQVEAATHDRWTIGVRDTATREEMIEAAREAVWRGLDVVLATGGDGTLNLVLNGVRAGMAEHGGEGPAVGLIPCGTGNVWAIEAGIPRRIEDAVAMIERGERRRADLGLAQIGDDAPRAFLLMCGVGLDANVVQLVDARPRVKQRGGRAAFVLPALAAIGRSRPVETTIEADGVTITAPLRQAIAGNSRLYGGVMRLANAARLDDGVLDLVTFTAPGGWLGGARSLGLALRAVRGGLATARSGGIRYQRSEHIVLRPAEPMPVQVDGDFHGVAGPEAPLTLTVAPAGVTVITGARARVLFEDGAAAGPVSPPA